MKGKTALMHFHQQPLDKAPTHISIPRRALYTPGGQNVAVMSLPERPLLERGCEDVASRRQLKQFNENSDTCFENLREGIKCGSIDGRTSAKDQIEPLNLD